MFNVSDFCRCWHQQREVGWFVEAPFRFVRRILNRGFSHIYNIIIIYIHRFKYIRSYQRPTVHSQRLQAAGGLLCKGPQCIVHGENRSRRIASSLCMSLPFLPHRCLTSAFRGSPWYMLVSHLIPMVWHGERISELTPLVVFRKSRPTIYGGSSSC